MRKALKEVRHDKDNPVWKQCLLGFAGGFIGGVVIALILRAIG